MRRRAATVGTAAVVGAAALAVASVAALLVTIFTTGSDRAPAEVGSGTFAPDDEVVTTTAGRLRGVHDGTTRSWRGIPFAAPPTGERRWRPPAAAQPWTGVRNADTPGPGCLQPEPYTFGARSLVPRPGTSEDCLYLEVSRPDDDRTGLPVMVWIHGGGFFAGSGSSATDVAAGFARRGVVLVALNYRLGRLGYFAHPSLPGETGNFGLLDQVAALQWVRDNIDAFGGDPGAVTVAGGSAGAMSVNALMATPAADGLFARAIAQSAPGDSRAQTMAQARRTGEAFLPGRTRSQLYALPGRALLDGSFNTLAGDAPLVDAVMPRSAAATFAAGDEATVPYLLGTTASEFGDDAFASFGVDAARLRDGLGGPEHAALVSAYGAQAYEADVLNDLVFGLPAVELAVQHARRAPTYRYVFARPAEARHGAESAYVFDLVPDGGGAALSDAVADYWAGFVTSGSLEADGHPAWPQVSAGSPGAWMQLGPDRPVPHDDDTALPRLAALRQSLS
ncbi:carboxylesterase/lipase family protein [Nocardioides litoris]|uniref:carboxylesterase/lipase family protein n=1 Tax=Nocardioides litoris TaxID=1926648 RepID=UPI00111FE983|nr:carboxylesterase family protein [Nocardioides litoris]